MTRTLDRGVLVAAISVIVLLLLNAAIAYRNTRQLREDADWVTHTHTVIDQTDGVLLALDEAETGERGFLLTNKEVYLQPYSDALPRLAERLSALKRLAEDNSSQQERISKLESMATTRLEQLQQRVELRRRRIDDPGALAAAEKGREEMRKIRVLVAEMKAEEEDLLKLRERRSAASYQVALLSGLLTAALGIGAVAGFVLLVHRSLQARQLAEQAERAQAKTLTGILAATVDHIFVVDRKGRYLYVSAGGARVLGFEPGDLIGKDWRELALPASLMEQFDVQRDQVLQSGQPAHHEASFRTPDGELLFDYTIAPISGEDSRPESVVVVSRDVTERRRAELAIREAAARHRAMEEHLTALVQASAALTGTLEPSSVLASILKLSERLLPGDAHAIWRLESRSGRWQIVSSSGLSDAYQRAAIRVLEETPSMPDSPLIAEDILESTVLGERRDAYRAEGIRALMVAPLKIHGKICGTLVVYHRQPHRFGEVEVSVASAVANLSAGAIGSADLFEEQSRLRAEARENKERLEVTLSSIGDAVIATDVLGRVTFVNPVAEALTGWRVAEAVGRRLEEVFNIITEDTFQPVENPVIKVLREGNVIGLANHTLLIAKNGTRLPIDDSAAPIRDQQRNVVGVVLVFRDNSERRRTDRLRAARLAFSQILAQSASIEEAATRLLDAVCKQFGWCMGAFWTTTADGHELRCKVAHAGDPAKFQEFLSRTRRLTLAANRDLPGRVAMSRQSAWIADVSNDPDFVRAEAASRSDIHGAIAFPAFLEGAVLGVIEFFARDLPQPDDDLIEIMTTLGGQLGQFMERRRAEAAVREEARVNESLYRIGSALAGELELQSIVQVVTDETTGLIGAQFGSFFYNVVGEHGESYLLYALSGASREAFANFPTPRNTALFEPTFRGERVVRLDDVSRDPRFGKNAPYFGLPEGHLPVRSYMAVPVVSRTSEVLGGLFFGHAEVGVFSERHERVVSGVAAQAAVAVDNARLYARVRESEARLAAIVNNSPAIIFLKDTEGRYILVNRRFEESAEVWGIEGPYLGRTDAELVPSELSDRFRRDDLEVIATKQVKVYEETWELGGVRRTGITTKFPLLDDAGHVYAVCGINLDITDRKQAEENVSKSAERLRLALEAGRMGVWDWNILSSEIKWIENLEPIYGLAPGTFGGTLEAFQKLVYPDDRERVSRALQHAIETRTDYDVEFRNVRPDGSVHWIAGKGKVFTDEGLPVRMVGVGMDITERKRAEEDTRFLADASAALAGLVDYESTLQKVARLAVPTFADWCTVDMLYENGTLRRLAVAHIDPAKVELAHQLHRRYPPSPKSRQGVWNIIRTGKSTIVSEISDQLLAARMRNKEYVKIIRDLGLRSYMGVPLSLRDKVLGVVTFIAAESGRRYDAKDLAVAEDLAHRAAVAIENARLYQAVREGDRRKDEFLALLGHELRNPLAPISNALNVLKIAGADPAIARRALEMMERQVEHMVRLVDDLLDVSRIMRGKVELRRETVDLATVIARAVETSQPLIQTEGHALSIEVEPTPMKVSGDLVRLAQVVSNLLNNAAKYTERGGNISLSVSTEGNNAVLRVRDNGIGIAPEVLPRLFDMFFQAERRTKESQGGLGIGLSLVRRLVELHDGRIEVHSDGPGTGSEFIVWLPRLEEDRNDVALEKPERQTVNVLASRRVMIVDDNVDAAESLAILLRLEGHDVEVAEDGPTALSMAEGRPPAIALLDLGMPNMDGYELARAFLTHPDLKHIILVALTGWGQPEDRQRTKEAGFSYHLVKPVDMDALKRILAGHGDR